MNGMKGKPRIWELKQSADDPTILEMYVYDYIEGDYYDWWTGVTIESETSAEYFKKELAKYPDIEQINLYVNSYGGYVYEAMAIRNQLKRHSAKVVGIVDGFACSSASFLLTGCDFVKMYSNTMQMIHEIRVGIYGNSKELRKAADDNDVIMQGNRQAYLEKSAGKITDEKLKELMEAETWLTAQQCLEYGLCDEIIGQEVDLTKAKEMLQKVNRTFEQQLSYNKALVAQFQEFKQSLDKEPTSEPEPVPAVPVEPEPVPEPEPEPKPALNKPKQLLTALFGQRKEDLDA